MGDLMIGQRRSGQPRPWRAAVIGVGMLAAAVVVAWFIFERAVTYEPPSGEAGGAVQWEAAGSGSAAASSGGALAYRDARLQWRGGIAVLRVAGSGQPIGAAHGRLLGEQLVAAAARGAQTSLDALVTGEGLWARWTHELRVSWRLRFCGSRRTPASL